MKNFVLGFMFNDSLDHVCMITKNRPLWQAGFLNGVGGKIERVETALEAMTREFQEETGAHTKLTDWFSVCTLWFPTAKVSVFVGSDSRITAAVRTTTDEPICVKALNGLDPLKLIENVPALLDLSKQRIQVERCHG